MEKAPTDAERLFSSLVSVPLNMFVGLAGLLTSKGLVTRDEIAFLLRALADRAAAHGENEAAVRMLIEPILAQFDETASGPKS